MGSTVLVSAFHVSVMGGLGWVLVLASWVG